LFQTKTGFWLLDERIGLTYAKKEQLLSVLKHPEVPLHINPDELCARRWVRKRDVSFGPRTADGAKAWDTFQTLAAPLRSSMSASTTTLPIASAAATPCPPWLTSSPNEPPTSTSPIPGPAHSSPGFLRRYN
jgi:hypothetical protein